MRAVRRVFLLLFVLAAPPALAALFYTGGKLLLHATHRVIDPHILWYAAIVECVAFFLVAVLEAKRHW